MQSFLRAKRWSWTLFECRTTTSDSSFQKAKGSCYYSTTFIKLCHILLKIKMRTVRWCTLPIHLKMPFQVYYVVYISSLMKDPKARAALLSSTKALLFSDCDNWK